MAGNSNSGRKSYREELNTRKLADIAPKILLSLLEKHETGEQLLSTDELIKICQPIALKQMAERIEHSVTYSLDQDAMSALMNKVTTLAPQIEYHAEDTASG